MAQEGARPSRGRDQTFHSTSRPAKPKPIGLYRQNRQKPTGMSLVEQPMPRRVRSPPSSASPPHGPVMARGAAVFIPRSHPGWLCALRTSMCRRELRLRPGAPCTRSRCEGRELRRRPPRLPAFFSPFHPRMGRKGGRAQTGLSPRCSSAYMCACMYGNVCTLSHATLPLVLTMLIA